MTNREWLATFAFSSVSDRKLSEFIYTKLIHQIGKSYTDSILGVAQWFSEEHRGGDAE